MRSVSMQVYLPDDAPAEVSDLLTQHGLDPVRCPEPPAGTSEPDLCVATDRWLPALRARSMHGARVAIRWGGAVTLPMPVIVIPPEAAPAAVTALLGAATTVAESLANGMALEERALHAEDRIRALNDIGIALAAERDLPTLLDRILTEARRFTGSQAGSLYLLEEDRTHLRFVRAQCDTVAFDFREALLPVDGGSIAGHVALSGDTLVIEDVYDLAPDQPFAFNPAFDQDTGFRTRAMVALPLRDHEGQLVGVLQLMNPDAPDGAGSVYDDDLVPLLTSLATQAAVAVRATQLTQELRTLFEDFASAAVTAIELRDPTTAGHSHRVADLSTRLAEAVDRAGDGPLASVGFTRQEMEELRYAALLHDFGKIGVPERVLVKARKLEDHQLELIRERFAYARDRAAEDAYLLLRRCAERGAPPTRAELATIEWAQGERRALIEEAWAAVLAANEPTILHEEAGQALANLTDVTFQHADRGEVPLLTHEEFRLLTIARGSLSDEERRQIESHVTHTFTFLSRIPWTRGLRQIPRIAAAHHEKLDGRGYPLGLLGDEIPVQSRILAVCDIFDALTAADRPYKKAMPRDRSLRVLADEAAAGVLDTHLVAVFTAVVGP